jgi:dTDP-4-dehydrorhamnose reductase
MKVAITGAAGLFGRGLVQVFSGRHEVYPLTRADADITVAEQVQAAFKKIKPDVVIHPAGIPDLDVCEAEPAKAYLVNVHGTRHVVEAARGVGAGVAYISTDAVFDGEKTSPYLETDPTNPPTVYGRTKVRAEKLVKGLPWHWIFRVSVLFGPGKTNIIERALRNIMTGREFDVASDQLGLATYTLDAGLKIKEIIEKVRCGVYHLGNQGQCTRLELVKQAAKLAGLDSKGIIGKPAEQMGQRAVRLKYSVMELGALKSAGIPLPRPWQKALAEYVPTLLALLRPKGHEGTLS